MRLVGWRALSGLLQRWSGTGGSCMLATVTLHIRLQAVRDLDLHYQLPLLVPVKLHTPQLLQRLSLVWW